MNRILRIGMLLCSFLLASVGWAMAQEGERGGGTTGITTLDELKNAINSNATEITLGGDIKDISEAITISRALTLDSNGNTISGSVSNGALLEITGTGTVTIKNLTVANNTEDGGSEIYVGTNPDTSTEFPATAASFENIKLSGTSEVGIAAEYHVNISIKNVQETSPHQMGVMLQGSDEQLKASLTIEGTENKFDKCVMPVVLNYSGDVTVEGSNFTELPLPKSEEGEVESKAWTDRYNSTDKSYKITLQDRDQKVVLMELQLIADLVENGSDIEKLIFGAGTLDLTSWSPDGVFTINSSLAIEGAGSNPENGGTKIVGQIDIVSPDEKENTPSSKAIVFKNLAIEGNTGTNGLLNVMTANVDLLLEGVTLVSIRRNTHCTS